MSMEKRRKTIIGMRDEAYPIEIGAQMEGYIKLFRKILDNPIVCKDSDYFAVWCFLLLNAAHDDFDALFNGHKTTLHKGQIITCRKTICKVYHLSDSKVQRILKTFEIERQIEQRTTPNGRLITVLNWDQYQSSEQPNDQQVNNDRTTNEQRVNSNKNVENVEKVNTPPIAPQGGESEKNPQGESLPGQTAGGAENDSANHSMTLEERFACFWKAYPRKKSKGQAEKAWKQIKPSQGLLDIILSAVNLQRQSQDWTRDGGRYIPYPATWLRAKGWEDEVPQNGKDDFLP